MKSTLRLGALAALVLLAPALLVAQKQTRTVFVSAVDQAGAPVLNLTPAEFDVKEGDAKRQVLSAALSTGPMRIMMLIDTGSNVEPFQGQMKIAMTAFLDGIPEGHEIGVMSMGRQSRVRLAPTTDRAKLKDVLSKMTLDAGGVAYFDALRDGETRFQKKDGVRWPIYVTFITDETEASSSIQQDEFTRLATDMISRGTTVHTAYVTKFGPTPATDIASMLARNTGGVLEEVTTPNSLAEKMKMIAARIVSDEKTMATRYQVEYASDAKYTGGVDVGVTREGVKGTITQKRSF